MAAQITFSDTKWAKSEVCEFDLKSTEASCNRSEINSDKIFNLNVEWENTIQKSADGWKWNKAKKHLQLSQVWKIYLGDIIQRGILFILSVWKEKSCLGKVYSEVIYSKNVRVSSKNRFIVCLCVQKLQQNSYLLMLN